MKGIVTKLFDIDHIVFPSDMFELSIDETQIDERIHILSLKYAGEKLVDTAAAGDTVVCAADPGSYPDGRTILLYTGMELPGATDAAQKAVGRSVGDTFDTLICDVNVRLTVQKIIRKETVPVTDALIASLGIEDVTTVSAYRSYLRAEALEEQRSQQEKAAIQYALQLMVEGSEFHFDEARLEEQLQSIMQEYAADAQEAGFAMDPEELRQLAALQIKQGWVARAYCESKGIEIDLSGIEEEINAMIEMQMLMGQESMDREAYMEIFVENQYLAKLFEALTQKVQSIMEV